MEVDPADLPDDASTKAILVDEYMEILLEAMHEDPIGKHVQPAHSRLGAVNQASQGYTSHHTGYTTGNMTSVIGGHSPVYPTPTWGTPRGYTALGRHECQLLIISNT